MWVTSRYIVGMPTMLAPSITRRCSGRSSVGITSSRFRNPAIVTVSNPMLSCRRIAARPDRATAWMVYPIEAKVLSRSQDGRFTRSCPTCDTGHPIVESSHDPRCPVCRSTQKDFRWVLWYKNPGLSGQITSVAPANFFKRFETTFSIRSTAVGWYVPAWGFRINAAFWVPRKRAFFVSSGDSSNFMTWGLIAAWSVYVWPLSTSFLRPFLQRKPDAFRHRRALRIRF